MKKLGFVLFTVVMTMFLISGCSKSQLDEFQTNDKSAPFNIFHLFDGYPALTAAWNSVPGTIGNHKMAKMMKDDIPGTADFLYILSFLMDRAGSPGLGLLDHIKATLNLATDSSERFYGNNRVGPTYNINSFYGDNGAPTYINDFYGFLDEVSRNVGGATPKVGESVVSIISKIMPYLLTKSDADLARYLEEMYMPTFYSLVDYGGTAIRLKEGSYNTAQLSAAGIADNSISSLKVPSGYKVTLYNDGNFITSLGTFDSSMCKLDITIDNLTSSLKIEKNPAAMTDLAELLAGPMAIADFPMFITQGATPGEDALIQNISAMPGGTDSDLGNIAKGMQQLLAGFIGFMNGETVDRASMYELFGGINNALSDTGIIKRLVWNLSNYFTVGGKWYGTAEDNANTVVDTTATKYCTDSTQLYSDVQIHETLREVLAALAGLFQKDSRRSSYTWYNGIATDNYLFAQVIPNVKKLYINWEEAQIKESIYDMVRFDMFGRDRQSNSYAYKTSLLEHLLYLSAIGGNLGFKWRPNTNEVYSGDTYDTVQRENGHGEHTGFLTLNDSLFSLESQKDATAGVGTYDIAFYDDDTGDPYNPLVNTPWDPDLSEARRCVYRSRDAFNVDVKANRQFIFTLNYPAIRFASGFSVGDYGIPAGGNPSGPSPAKDGYVPYNANGINTKDLGSWTFSQVIRACWEGEGPYYSTQGTTQAGNAYTYYRPDGSVYAVVTKPNASDASTWTYVYPDSADYDNIDPSNATQRWNRYRESWNTDYYMIETRHNQGSNVTRYWVPKDSDGDTQADAAPVPPVTGKSTAATRTYYEIVPEKNADRECASHEEAIFRNFQWVVNEKKMVLVIPMYIYADIPVVGGCSQARMESAVYQIIEGNGITGLSLARKYRANGVWAKANSGDTSDGSCSYANTSKIPGDYRITVLATPTRYQIYLFGWLNSDLAKADSVKVYDNTIGRGTATPGIVGHNFFALSRLGFPRSNEVTLAYNGRNYKHSLLGSRKIANSGTDSGFLLSDTVWANRNQLVPMFIALLAPLKEKSTTSNNALAKMLEGLKFLVKPMVYFNYNIGSTNGYTDVARYCWLPRIMGPRTLATDAWPSASATYKYNAPHSRSLISDWDVPNFDSSDTGNTAWLGGWGYVANPINPQDYYRPEEIPTILSVLIDSDTSQTRSTMAQRADGLLSKLLAYSTFPNRPSVTGTLVTPRTYTAEEITALNKLCLGLEQLTSGIKTDPRARGTEIEERLSGGTCGGTVTALSSVKQLDLPEWMFKKRIRPDNGLKYIDMDLDDLLNRVVGKTANEGLRQFHDTNGTYDDGTPDFNNLANANDDGALDILHTLSNDFLIQGAQYPLSQNLFDIIDALYQHNPTDAEIKGAVYNLGKLLAFYNGTSTKWLFQGDTGFSTLYDFLMAAIPIIDNEMALYSSTKGQAKGVTYRSLLTSLQNASADGGLVQFIMDTVSANPYSSGDMLNELSLWLDSDLISGTNTVFYSTMAELLEKMADITLYAPSEEGLYSIYDQYGYQRD